MMTSSDTNVDLIINQLTEDQYLQLSASGLIDDNQLYLVPDDGEYYNKSETSSAVEIDAKIGEIETQINPSQHAIEPDAQGYYNCYSSQFNYLGVMLNESKICLKDYSFGKSYSMRFETPMNSEVRFNFYVDNGTGPHYDQDMYINTRYLFPMGMSYVINIKYDNIDVRPDGWTGDRQKMTFRSVEWQDE